MTWTEPRELHEQTVLRFTQETTAHYDWARKAMVTTETWTQFIDWNGDGRLDVIEARGGSDDDHWKVWLNEADAAGVIRWRATEVDMRSLRSYLMDRRLLPFDISDLYPHTNWSSGLPLERTRSWARSESFKAASWYCEMTFVGVRCTPAPIDPSYDYSWHVDSMTEWLLADRNADGFPDFVTTTAPVRHCEPRNTITSTHPECNRSPPEPPADMTRAPLEGSEGTYMCSVRHTEWISGRDCDASTSDRVDAVYFANIRGPYAGPAFGSVPTEVVGVADSGVLRWTTGSDTTLGGPMGPPSTAPGVSWQANALVDPSDSGVLALLSHRDSCFDAFSDGEQRPIPT